MIASITVHATEMADPARVVPREIELALTKSVLLLERAAKQGMPIGVTGAGRGSIAGEVRMGMPIGLGESIGTVGSPLKHVAVINDGRRPGKKPPPAEALELWVRRKIVWSSRKGPRGGRRRLTGSEARGIAFVIARAIGRRGIEGKHFFEDALEQNQGAIQRFFEEAGLKITLELAR